MKKQDEKNDMVKQFIKSFEDSFSALVVNLSAKIREDFIDEFIQKLKWNKSSKVFEIDLKDVEKYQRIDVAEKEDFRLDKIIVGVIFGASLIVILLIILFYLGIKFC